MAEAAVKENAAKTAATEAEKATATGDKFMKDAMSKATAMGDQAFREGMDKSLSSLNEMNAHSKRNLEAVVASVTAATKGAEALSAQAMAYTKKTVEGQVEQARALSGARSMQEVVELQTTYAKSALEAYVAELSRLTETLSSAVKESFRPLNERTTAVVETLQAVR
ncbi:phasin family protein [Caulobacter sp. S45]|uniref:phasin family protein n=1 Tax=Caulobacter sp. S45 TaxID=1641861 RepID=UPI00352A60AD